MKTESLPAVSAWFGDLPARLRAEEAGDLEAKILYRFEEEEEPNRLVAIRGGKASVEESEASEANLVLDLSTKTFLGIVLGRLDLLAALGSGRLRLSGDKKLAERLSRLFRKASPRPTAKAVIESLPGRLRPSKAAGLDVAIGYDLGTDGSYTALIKQETCRIVSGITKDCDLVQRMTESDFVAMVLGELDPLTAISSGRLALEGSMDLARLLPRLFCKFEAGERHDLIVLRRNISVEMEYATGEVMGRFLAALKEKKLLANVCPRCGRKQIPPREVCAPCRCRATGWTEVGPEGTLVLLETVYYASPDPLTGKSRDTPYGDIRVLLDGCRGREAFWHLLRPDQLHEVARGDRLRPVFADQPTGSIHDILWFEKVP